MDYAQEIIDLHQFFEDWFNARLEQSAFSRFADTMAAHFVIISPGGQLSERPALLDGLRAAYGQRPGLRIWIENIRLRHQQNTLLIVTYEEWQQHNDSPPTARLSTVVFQQEAAMPHGLMWLHVHETWLPV
ncbi:MAG: hypothetical protein OHK0046_25350 [Anaerolineae bacterium]